MPLVPTKGKVFALWYSLLSRMEPSSPIDKGRPPNAASADSFTEKNRPPLIVIDGIPSASTDRIWAGSQLRLQAFLLQQARYFAHEELRYLVPC